MPGALGEMTESVIIYDITDIVSVCFFLPEPKFVGSFWVPESENPDDDKVFFFFRETAVEAQGLGKSTYSRIGQLCRVRNCFITEVQFLNKLGVKKNNSLSCTC